jgi:hypothetical protein
VDSIGELGVLLQTLRQKKWKFSRRGNHLKRAPPMSTVTGQGGGSLEISDRAIGKIASSEVSSRFGAQARSPETGIRGCILFALYRTAMVSS